MKIKNIGYSYICLALILLSALAIRLYSIGANLPYAFWHDENNYIEDAMRLGKGNFVPSTFSHGGLFQLVLLFFYTVLYIIFKILNVVHAPIEFYVKYYLHDPSILFIIGRSISILCGIGLSYMIFLIAKRIFNSRVALIACFFSSFSLIMVQMSLFSLADIPSIFLLVAGFLLLTIDIQSARNNKLFYASCLLIGMAAACKYFSAVGIIPICAAVIIKSVNAKESVGIAKKLLFFGILCVMLGFILGVPLMVIAPSKFLNDSFIRLSKDYIIDKPGSAGLDVFLLLRYLRDGLGAPVQILSILGVIYAIYKHSKWDMLLVSLPVCYLLFLATSKSFAYHALPAIPFIIILAARFLDVFVSKISKGLLVTVIFSSCVLLPTALNSIKFITIVASQDTRIKAKLWIESNIPIGSAILSEGYIATFPVTCPPITGNRKIAVNDIALIRSAGGSGYSAMIRIKYFDDVYGHGPSYDLAKTNYMRAKDILRVIPKYIILTSFNDKIGSDELSFALPENYFQEREESKKVIAQDYELLQSFLPTEEFTFSFPHLLARDYITLRRISFSALPHFVNGPIIYIYKRKA